MWIICQNIMTCRLVWSVAMFFCAPYVFVLRPYVVLNCNAIQAQFSFSLRFGFHKLHPAYIYINHISTSDKPQVYVQLFLSHFLSFYSFVERWWERNSFPITFSSFTITFSNFRFFSFSSFIFHNVNRKFFHLTFFLFSTLCFVFPQNFRQIYFAPLLLYFNYQDTLSCT